MTPVRIASSTALFVAVSLLGVERATAADLTLELSGDGAEAITFVGAFNRWDQDGNARKKVDPKQKIDAPPVDATAKKTADGVWTFSDLPKGTYDVIVMAKDRRLRLEGFNYPPVLEFDPFLSGDAEIDDETAEFIADDISKAQHYENKVRPLSMGRSADDKWARVLVMLIRDKPTSYERDFPGAATIRHEVWQYDWQYGGWLKEKRTRVLDRVLLHRDELRQWTWLWTPALGGIEMAASDQRRSYALPDLTGDDRPA